MGRHDFTSVKDVQRVARAVVEFANDACCSHLFEIAADGESNLFRSDDLRFNSLARAIKPDLDSKPGLEHLSEMLPLEASDRLLEIVTDIAHAYFTIGMMFGAREADPTGKSCQRIANGWVRATISRPRYEYLRAKTGASPTASRKKSRARNKRHRHAITATK